MLDSTSTITTFKTCGSGDQCVHPKGPSLPKNPEFFYFTNKGYPRKYCKACDKAKRREYHKENRDHENSRSRQYAKEHPDEYEHYQAHYQARYAAAGARVTFKQINEIYTQQKGLCWWCSKFVGLSFEIDHRVPLTKGGTNDPGNIVVSCHECNKGKKDKNAWEFNGRLL